MRRYSVYPVLALLVLTSSSCTWLLSKTRVVKKEQKSSNEYVSNEKKGEFLLKLSLPWVNNFCLKPQNENYKVNTGFVGFAAGLDYYHTQKQFLNVTGSTATNFFIPVPAPAHFEGVHTFINSSSIAVSNNHKLKRISLGYGISYSNNVWDLQYSGSREDTLAFNERPRRKSYSTLGFMFPAHYQIKKSLYAGIIYRPTFFRFNTSEKFAYEHLISIDIGWRIRL
ncbi:MAG: hypothetical protein V4556_09215 [Bacteroidota bacterium]